MTVRKDGIPMQQDPDRRTAFDRFLADRVAKAGESGSPRRYRADESAPTPAWHKHVWSPWVPARIPTRKWKATCRKCGLVSYKGQYPKRQAL